MRHLLIFLTVFPSACTFAPLDWARGIIDPKPEEIIQPDVVAQESAMRPVARPTAASQRPQMSPVSFGTTIASLGNPAEPGLWLKTPLVSKPILGRVTTGDGAFLDVQLLPLDGPQTGGSRISLAAMQALGLRLVDLPELVVDPV